MLKRALQRIFPFTHDIDRRKFKPPKIDPFVEREQPKQEEKKKPSKRSTAFNPEAPPPLSNRPRDTSEEDWVATPWNGMIPVVAVVVIGWGLSEKYLRTLPCPNDGPFGPMRYANNPDAKYWGNYRRDIQPRKGRRHFDWGM